MEQEIRDLIELSTTIDTVKAFRAWKRRCDERLEVLREKCRNKRLKTCTGSLHSLIFQIRLEGARNVLCERFTRVGGGGGGGDRPGFFRWTEIETAFHRHVSTGVISNLTYVEP